MSLKRVLEEEVMDSTAEAEDYDAMDHSTVNRAFADDLLAFAAKHQRELGDVLDLGTGTAQIPLILCERDRTCRVMATDLATSMLDKAVINLAISDLANLEIRLVLNQADAKNLKFEDGMFDTVISNSIVHHLPEPLSCLRGAIRVCKPGGIIFFRDLLRPESDEEVSQLVQSYAGDENENQRKMFDDSLRAALTLDEIRDLVKQLGFDEQAVSRSSDRHWTWNALNS